MQTYAIQNEIISGTTIHYMNEEIDGFWKDKIDRIIEISNKHGYEELDFEFWKNQPAIVISFIINLYEKK